MIGFSLKKVVVFVYNNNDKGLVINFKKYYFLYEVKEGKSLW